MRLTAVQLLFTVLLWATGQAMAPVQARAESCPQGQVWVKTSAGANANGQNLAAAWNSRTSGHCEPKDEDFGDDDRKSALERQCALEEESVEEAHQEGQNALRSDTCMMVGSATINVGSVVRSLIVRLRLPDANPRFGPNPNNNEWKMLAVGFPVWLWTDGPRHKEATASAYGITFRLVADLASTTFTTGDGGQVTCTSMSTYASTVTPGSPSPTCGHVYTKPSLPKGAYTVTATPQWRIRWSADGFSGTLTTSYSDSSQIRIGELRALNR